MSEHSQFAQLLPPGAGTDFVVWRAMYLGAFEALRIQNLAACDDLAMLTRSDEEAAKTIERLRDGREGDRVYPALAELRELRRISNGPVNTVEVKP